MTTDQLATISIADMNQVTGGYGPFRVAFANRFPIATAAFRRVAFGPGAARHMAANGAGGCLRGNCGG